MSRGCTGVEFGDKLYIGVVFKAEIGVIRGVQAHCRQQFGSTALTPFMQSKQYHPL